MIEDPGALGEIVTAAREAGRLSIAVVGSAVDPMRAELVGLAVAVRPGRAWYLPLGHVPPTIARDESGNPVLRFDEPEEIPANLPSLGASDDPGLEALRELLLDPDLPKIGHDLKYALHLLERAGAPAGGLALDTSLASYCLDPGKRQHDLDLLVLERFGHTLASGGRRAGADLAESPSMSWDRPRPKRPTTPFDWPTSSRRTSGCTRCSICARRSRSR